MRALGGPVACTSKGTLTHTPGRMAARTERASDSTRPPRSSRKVRVGRRVGTKGPDPSASWSPAPQGTAVAAMLDLTAKTRADFSETNYTEKRAPLKNRRSIFSEHAKVMSITAPSHTPDGEVLQLRAWHVRRGGHAPRIGDRGLRRQEARHCQLRWWVRVGAALSRSSGKGRS